MVSLISHEKIGIQLMSYSEFKLKIVVPFLCFLSTGKPEFEPLLFGDRLVDTPLKKSRKAKLLQLEELLLRPDGELVRAIASHCRTSDLNTMAPALIYIFEFHEKAYELLESAITAEVSQTT